jgi:hypothetical protein
MNETSQSLEELIQDLPLTLRAEVREFVEGLLAKQSHVRGRRLRQDWAGALHAHQEQYTSVELQHRALEWRDHN